MVSVDFKHHVYLLSWRATTIALLSPHRPPNSPLPNGLVAEDSQCLVKGLGRRPNYSGAVADHSLPPRAALAHVLRGKRAAGLTVGNSPSSHHCLLHVRLHNTLMPPLL